MILDIVTATASTLACGGLAYLILKDRGAPKPASRTPSRGRPKEALRPMVGFTAAFAPPEPKSREPEPARVLIPAATLGALLNQHDPQTAYDLVRRGGTYVVSYAPAPPGAVNRPDKGQKESAS